MKFVTTTKRELFKLNTNNVTLSRSLTLLPIVLFGLAYMAPMTVFSTYGIGLEASKGMLASAYILTLITMLFTGYSYGKMVKAYPTAGSAYTYVQKTISPHVGFLVGWVILLDYLLLPMINFLIAGLFLADAFPSVPADVWIAINILVVTVVNILGIKLNTRINGLLLLYMSVVITLFFVLAIKAVLGGAGSGTLLSMDPFISDTASLTYILSGAALVSLSFLGFDAITTISEETINPTKTIPKAIIITLLIGGALFIGVSYVAYLVNPNYMSFNTLSTAASEVAHMIGGNVFNVLFLAGILTSTTASALASHASASRLLFAMGRDNVIPKKVFGYVHHKFRTPIYNVILIGLFSCTGIFLDLAMASSLINFGAFVAFIFVNLSVISYYFVKRKERSGKQLIFHLIFPLAGAFLTLTLWVNLGSNSLSVGLLWFALGVLYLAYQTKGFTRKPPQFDFTEENTLESKESPSKTQSV